MPSSKFLKVACITVALQSAAGTCLADPSPNASNEIAAMLAENPPEKLPCEDRCKEGVKFACTDDETVKVATCDQKACLITMPKSMCATQGIKAGDIRKIEEAVDPSNRPSPPANSKDEDIVKFVNDHCTIVHEARHACQKLVGEDYRQCSAETEAYGQGSACIAGYIEDNCNVDKPKFSKDACNSIGALLRKNALSYVTMKCHCLDGDDTRDNRCDACVKVCKETIPNLPDVTGEKERADLEKHCDELKLYCAKEFQFPKTVK